MEKTHKFEMDGLGSFHHSPDCWCFKTPTNEPNNNDGRKFCYWCGGATKKIDLFTSNCDFCDNCGK